MSTNVRSLSAFMAAAMLAPIAAAAPEYCPLEVRTATVTACFTNTGAPVKPTCDVACPTPVAKPKGDGPIQVFVQAPKCDSCGCDSCAHTNIYTTTYDVFCPTGLSKQEYVVTEVYAGMSAKPKVTEAPKVPFGFAVGVQTCNECGKKPVVATLTYPAEGCPYMKGMSEPKGAPAGSPAYAVCVDSPAGPGKPILPGPPGSPGGGPGAGPNNVPGWAPGAYPGKDNVPGAVPAGPGAAPGGGAQPGGGAIPAAPGSGPNNIPGAAPGGGAQPAAAPAGGAAPAAPPAKDVPYPPPPGAAPAAPAAPAGGASPAGGAAPPAKENNASPPAPPAKDVPYPPPAQPTGLVQVAAAHPAFVPITMGTVLGFLLSFVAAL